MITSGGDEAASNSSAALPSDASLSVPTPRPRSSFSAVRRWKWWSSTTSTASARTRPAVTSGRLRGAGLRRERGRRCGGLQRARRTASVSAEGSTPSSAASTSRQCS